MTPEKRARQHIDLLLQQSGWIIQDCSRINLSVGAGVAVCEVTLKTGEADYLLFAGGKANTTVEAKPEGYTLIGVEEQSGKYGKGFLDNYRNWGDALPFAYESTGSETRFINRLDPNPASRGMFAFHRPETLIEWAAQAKQLKTRLRKMPQLITGRFWHPQIEPIQNLEKSLVQKRTEGLRQSILHRAFSGHFSLSRANSDRRPTE
jgi:type I restriction enzyme R subunit